jgi:hypothetical protein
MSESVRLRAIVVLAAATLAVGACASPVGTRASPGPGPTTSSTAAPSAAATSTSSSSVLPRSRSEIGPWVDVLSLSERFDPTGNMAIAVSLGSASDGAVAVKVFGASTGSNPIQPVVTMYRTFDGRAWTQNQVPNPTNAVDAAVACRSLNCVAILGRAVGRFGVLQVTDDGVTWSESPAPADLVQTGIVAGGDCFLLSGYDSRNGKQVLLRSVDGRIWTPVAYAPGSPPLAAIFPRGYDPNAGWIALGWFDGGKSENGRVGVATSPDGLTWTEAIAGSGDYDLASANVQDVVHFDGRWYVYTSYITYPSGLRPSSLLPARLRPTPVAVWQIVRWLEDGSQILSSSERTSASLPFPSVAMDGYLVGLDIDGTRVLTSTDGITWVPGDPLPPLRTYLSTRAAPQIARAGPSVLVLEEVSFGSGMVGGDIYLTTPTSG